jgi:hypothetical protein
LKGSLLTDGEITIGASIILDGTQNVEITQIKGEFEIEKPVGTDFNLIINPCCTCYVSTRIPVRKEAIELEIDCKCKRYKAFVVQKLKIDGEIVEKKSKVKIGN